MLTIGGMPSFGGSFNEQLEAFIKHFKLLCSVLKLGLLSYSGSHTCAFDETIFNQHAAGFKFGDCYTLRRKPLKCLREFINGPVWVFEKVDATNEEYFISVTLGQFADLWGPVFAISAIQEPQSFSMVHTERGVIHPTTSTLSEYGEVQCH